MPNAACQTAATGAAARTAAALASSNHSTIRWSGGNGDVMPSAGTNPNREYWEGIGGVVATVARRDVTCGAAL